MTVPGRLSDIDLVAHPGEWAKLRAGADMTVATEELIRYVTPIHNMCRVANTDYDVGWVTIPQGNQVLLMYGSANRDPAHFDDLARRVESFTITPGTTPEEMPNAFVYGLRSAHLDLQFA